MKQAVDPVGDEFQVVGDDAGRDWRRRFFVRRRVRAELADAVPLVKVVAGDEVYLPQPRERLIIIDRLALDIDDATVGFLAFLQDGAFGGAVKLFDGERVERAEEISVGERPARRFEISADIARHFQMQLGTLAELEPVVGGQLARLTFVNGFHRC